MSILICKSCGGDLEINASATVGTCTFCNTKQTLPKSGNEVLDNLFNRANALRLKGDFDKAEQVYEKILQENNAEPEAHWGMVLCKYGIEYVEDPKTYKRIPTCHRTSYDAVTSDAEYKAAIQYADAEQKAIYEAEAKAIDEIQKNILSIVKDEKPFDVFICYKETDEDGKRTMDSAIANDIYHQLTLEGLKVFYAAITLEDKLGREYEPYIFAALNSAKVMLVIGTKPRYFSAVWVKNEWSRFLKLMKSDRNKLLIPCYKDMDAYELPEEFAHLQAQDMSKIGFINDVVRGIKKVTVKDEPKPAVVQETVVKETVASSNNTAPLLERAFMFLEDGKWDSANEYCEKVLDLEPKNAQAYLGKLLADLHVKKQAQLKDYQTPFDSNDNYQKALRFGDEALKNELQGFIEYIKTRNENARVEGLYVDALNAKKCAKREAEYKAAAKLFEQVLNYKDAASCAQQCLELAEAARKDEVLAQGITNLNSATVSVLENTVKLFTSISGWKDADALAEKCKQKIQQLKEEAEEKRKKWEQERILAQQAAEKRAKRNKKIATVSVIAVCAIIAFVVVLNTVIIPNSKYNDAVALMEAGNNGEAAIAFYNMKDYKDAKTQSMALWAQIAQRDTISAGAYHTVGLKADGTVVAVGKNDSGQCDVSGWTDIVAIGAGEYHTVGLKADGTVVAVGSNGNGRCDVSGWRDIVAISAGDYHTVGLKADGTVVAVGDYDDGRCDVSGWRDVVAISAGSFYTVGLKADGTVVAVGVNNDGQCNVSGWRDIVAISAGGRHTVGLKADGTVVAVGDIYDDHYDVSDWTDIVAISAGWSHTVGLKADGTVVAVGYNGDGRCDVSGWRDIVAISAGNNHTVGLKADGTVVAVGRNGIDQCDVSGWKGIKTP